MLQEIEHISFSRRATRWLGYLCNIMPPNGHADRSLHMKRLALKNSDPPILDEAHFQNNFDPDLMAETQADDIVRGLIANLIEETSALHLWLRNRALRSTAQDLDRGEGPSVFEPGLENSLHNIKGIAAVLGAVRLRVVIGEALAQARDARRGMPAVRIRGIIRLSEQTLRRIVRMRASQPKTETETEQRASYKNSISDEQLGQ